MWRQSFKTIYAMKIPHLTRGHDADSIRNLVGRFLDGDHHPGPGTGHIHILRQPQRAARRPRKLQADVLPGMRQLHRSAASATAPKSQALRQLSPYSLLQGVALIGANNSSTDRLWYAPYKGSYIIRDGQKIDDISPIYANLACTELMADSIIDQADQMAKRIEQSDDILIETSCRTSTTRSFTKKSKRHFTNKTYTFINIIIHCYETVYHISHLHYSFKFCPASAQGGKIDRVDCRHREQTRCRDNLLRRRTTKDHKLYRITTVINFRNEAYYKRLVKAFEDERGNTISAVKTIGSRI